MNIYIAPAYSNGYLAGGADKGRYASLLPQEQACVDEIPYFLESYHYIYRQKYVDAIRMDGRKIFLDSGAFSAWTLGTTIDLPTYCDYIVKNKDIIKFDDGIMMASVLDGIGDPLKTYENQMYMEKLGVKPLPCFHFGEDERYLEWYVANYPYITIGGMVGKGASTLQTWLDRIWDKYLVDGSGRPKVKTHAFGITSMSIMKGYPWYSVDSSTWVQMSMFGQIITEKFGVLHISDKSTARHTAGKHVSNMTPVEIATIEKMLSETCFTHERLAQSYESRGAYNMFSMQQIAKSLNESKASEHFKTHNQELF